MDISITLAIVIVICTLILSVAAHAIMTNEEYNATKRKRIEEETSILHGDT